jgi:hypothetical protein
VENIIFSTSHSEKNGSINCWDESLKTKGTLMLRPRLRKMAQTLHHLLNDFKDVTQSAKITKFFEEHATSSTNTQTKITAIDIERIDMSNIEHKLKKLMEDPNYKSAAEHILAPPGEKLRKLGMVTGIYVAKSLTVTEEEKKEKDIGGGFNVPGGELAGAPTNALDIEAKAKYEHTKNRIGESKIEVLSIFAIAYTDVGLRPIAPKTQHTTYKLMEKLGLHKNLPLAYEAYIDTSPGTKFFHGSSSESDDEAAEARSATSTDVGEPVLEENSPYVFTTPNTVLSGVYDHPLVQDHPLIKDHFQSNSSSNSLVI